MDRPGFQEFVEVRYTDLLRTAYLLTGDRAAAEDLVQAALLTTMRHWRSVADPMAYVRRAMVNRRTSLWRRIGSRELLTDAPPDRGVPDGAAGRAERDELLTALGRLPVSGASGLDDARRRTRLLHLRRERPRSGSSIPRFDDPGCM